MKTKPFILGMLLVIASVFLSSCEKEQLYYSGTYWYVYYLVNDFQDPIIIRQIHPLAGDLIDTIAPGAQSEYYSSGWECGSDKLETLRRPRLEDGLEGKVGLPTTLTVNGTTYEISPEQENSFMLRSNYKGETHPGRDFFYYYYFSITSDYIASLSPYKK